MDNADTGLIDKFLAQMTPAQETLVVLKEIRDQINLFGKVFIKLNDDGTYSSVVPLTDVYDGTSIADIVKNITPTKTPFMESIGGSKGNTRR
jgi:hypothetical protein